MDADLASKLEEQKKLREQIQRKKEARRQAQASQRRAALMKNLKQQGECSKPLMGLICNTQHIHIK